MDFSQIALVFVLAAAFGLIAKLLKQPLFVGYLLAGIFITVSGLISDFSVLESLGHIGITLLLFLMGIEMSLKDVSSVGKTAILTGLFQMFVSFIAGLLVAELLGFGLIPSLFVGISIMFSSTIVSMKMLGESDDLVSLYGRISIGILLLQDLVAVVILMVLAGSRTNFELSFWGGNVIKGFMIIVLLWYLSKKYIPLLFEKIIGSSAEFLFVFSIAWALGIAAFIQKFTGFSLEIGGFIAGLSLSTLPEHLQIATKARPLRDFFLTIFFLALGTGVVISGKFLQIFAPALVISLLALLVHLLSTMFIMGVLGYRKRTFFMTGLAITSISEFSLIISAIGLSMNNINKDISSIITLVGVITMLSSTYLMTRSDSIYKKYKNILGMFEKKRNKEQNFLPDKTLEEHVVLVGCDRTGSQIVNFLIKKKVDFVVVDYDPKVFTRLTAQNIPIVFGDINDEEVIESAKVNFASMVVLTTSNLSDNLNFLSIIKTFPHKPNTIFTSVSKPDAIKLYEAGASYVIVPDIVAGEHIKHLLKVYGFRGNRINIAGESHFKRLIFI